MIDKKVFEGKWKEIRARSKEWWGLINDTDLGRLDDSPDKLKKYIMLLQVKYGYTSKFGEEEINRRVEEHQAEEKKAAAAEPGKAVVPAPREKTGKN